MRIRVASPLVALVAATAILCGIAVGVAGGKISADAANSQGALAEQRATVAKELEATREDLTTARVTLGENTKARDKASKQYNSVGSRVEKLRNAVALLEEQNDRLRAEWNSYPTAPNLVGLDFYEAADYVNTLGLNAYTTERDGTCDIYHPYANTEFDEVISQYPSAGTKMSPGSYVTITRWKTYNEVSILCRFFDDGTWIQTYP